MLTFPVMADEINKGDIVQLKSGGPEMTVNEIRDTVDGKAAECIWQDGTKTQREVFGLHLLKKAEPFKAKRAQIKVPRY